MHLDIKEELVGHRTKNNLYLFHLKKLMTWTDFKDNYTILK